MTQTTYVWKSNILILNYNHIAECFVLFETNSLSLLFKERK